MGLADVKQNTVVEFGVSTNMVGSTVTEEFTLRDLGYTDGDFDDYGEFETWLEEEYQTWRADNIDSWWRLKKNDHRKSHRKLPC